jgi:hypothetical protein
MPGRKRSKIFLAAAITARSKRTVIGGKRSHGGVDQAMGQGSTTRGR